MSDHTASQHATNTRRGLATIAFLKARFDEGLGHLDMFQPFIEDAIRHYSVDDIDVPGVQKAVRDSTDLRIPAEIVMTLLRRAWKKGLLHRHGGRFLRTSNKDEDPEFAARIQGFVQVHTDLASRLRQFTSSRGQKLPSDKDALEALMRFLDAHHIGLVLGQPITVESSDTVERLNQVVAAFVTSVVEEGGPLRTILDDIVKGLIIQNALLLRDIPIKGRHLKGLTVFVDTGVLLRALGYAGPTEAQAATEALNLIHAAGARLKAFDRTVNEVEGILRVYERKLGSSASSKSLHSTPLTHHFLGIRATPSDIRQAILLLKTNLEKLGIYTQDFPTHIQQFTEDERALANTLRDPASKEDDYDERVWHDVQAIAAVLTLRKGARARRMANAKYVFASNSTSTIVSATRWYREVRSHSFEPMVHFRSVTNAAWFLRPANASNVPMHELVAVCAAVLQPSPKVWSRFVGHLDDLVQSGELSDDESIAVLANGFTHIEPGQLESEADMEATTVREIVERVRAEMGAELRSQLDDKQKQIEDRERKVSVAQDEADSIRATVQARTKRLATLAAKVIYAVLCIILLAGAVLNVPTEWSGWTRSGTIWELVGWVCGGTFLVASLLPFFTRRFCGLDIFDFLQGFLESRLQRMLLPENEHDDS